MDILYLTLRMIWYTDIWGHTLYLTISLIWYRDQKVGAIDHIP